MSLKTAPTRSGTAAFLFLAMQYIKASPRIRQKLAKKNLHLRLVLEATDLYPGALIVFNGPHIHTEPISKADCQDKRKWDCKMIAKAETFLDYFMGKLGAIRPMIFFKIKGVGMLKLTKLVWFIKENIMLFSPNRNFAQAVFYSIYNQGPGVE